MNIVSIVREFVFERETYLHVMDEDDNIHLVMEVYLDRIEEQIVLSFTHNLKIKRIANKKCDLGEFFLRDNFWWFSPKEGYREIKGNSFDEVEGLLDFEVEISKKFLSGLI